MNSGLTQVVVNLTAPVTYGPNQNAETVLMSYLFPKDILEPGALVRVSAKGIMTTVAGQPVMDLRLRLGPVTLVGVQVAKWTVFTSNNQTDKTWTLDADMTVQAGGVTAWGQGAVATSVNTQFQFGWVGSDQAAAVAFDNTIDNLVELTADWDDLAANILKMTNATLTVLSPVPS